VKVYVKRDGLVLIVLMLMWPSQVKNFSEIEVFNILTFNKCITDQLNIAGNIFILL
jgi:hypothetical protein